MIKLNNNTQITKSLIGAETCYGKILSVSDACDGTVDTRPFVEFEGGSIFFPSFTEFHNGFGTHYSSYWK